jgi:hypothetical protein
MAGRKTTRVSIRRVPPLFVSFGRFQENGWQAQLPASTDEMIVGLLERREPPAAVAAVRFRLPSSAGLNEKLNCSFCAAVRRTKGVIESSGRLINCFLPALT